MSNSNNDDKNLYTILGCTEDATIDDIRRNYKKLALKCHPDKQQQQQQQQNLPNDDDDDGQMMIKPEFSQLNQAATILSDSREKFKYDSSLLAQKSPQSIINDEINLNDFYKGNVDVHFICFKFHLFLIHAFSKKMTMVIEFMIVVVVAIFESIITIVIVHHHHYHNR